MNAQSPAAIYTPIPELSVIVPVFNEGENINLLVEKLAPVLAGCVSSWEVLFVDDGSRDDTLSRIRALALQNPNVRAVSFSRNFGKEIAIAAGLDHVRGRAVVIIDADLQHPPETIATFVAKWREGYDMVYGQRVDRSTDGPARRWLTERFYSLFERFGETALPAGAGDYRLMDAKVVENLRRMGERARFSKGLYAWVGFKSIGIPFEVQDRVHGQSKFSYRKLTSFAFDGLASFSTLPLKVSTYIGTIISSFAIIYALIFAVKTLFYGADVPGFPSLIVSVMFFSGIQLVFLGIIGEYVGRIFAEVKRRPLYIIAEEVGPDSARPEILARRGETLIGK
ncbi:MAG: glycosyltransferase family 2 protein [Proteobacteria bacterium]|nr:glycosyltransferase family 2 protein [Pseudomonadota bacterium]